MSFSLGAFPRPFPRAPRKFRGFALGYGNKPASATPCCQKMTDKTKGRRHGRRLLCRQPKCETMAYRHWKLGNNRLN
jgi:hypothetical protein